MIINIAHYEGISAVFKSHAVFSINVSLKYTGGTIYRVTAQTRVPEIRIKKHQRFIDLLLNRPWQFPILPHKALGEINRH